MIYGYARVSTRKQADKNSLEFQQKALTEAGAQKIYVDVFTGSKTNRPNFRTLQAVLKPGDTLVITKLDRFARSISQANEIMSNLLDRNVSIHVLNIGFIDNSPTSKLIRYMLLAFAEFERELIIERTQEGKQIARKNPDFKDGRPPKYTKKQVDTALKLLETKTYKEVSQLTGISKSSLVRFTKDHRPDL